ncbi:hypothetical protein GGR58DRAFT_454593 [Xylaria digitata]|nr:hypothetical protein GGR58DRAFT_454593 [Xylaria digitata]
MATAQNAVIAILLVFLFLGIGILFWKGRKLIEHFAHVMFTAKQAQQEQQEQPPQRRRRTASIEASV